MLAATHAVALTMGFAVGHVLLAPPRPGPRTLEELAGRCAAAGLHVHTGNTSGVISVAIYLSDHPLTQGDFADLRLADTGGPAWKGVVYVTLSRPDVDGAKRAGPYLLAGDAVLMAQVAALCR